LWLRSPGPATLGYGRAIIDVGAALVMTALFFIMVTMIDRLLIWWLRTARYPWSRLRRRILEAKYSRLPLPPAGSLEDIEAWLRQVTWTMDGPLHLFDAVSYPQTVWAKKKDDCDGFAVLAAALLSPMRKSHTVCALAVPGVGLWFFDNYTLRRGRYQTYAEIVQQVKGENRLVCWDVADPETLQALEFHVAAHE
jgi:hypothetical protein